MNETKVLDGLVSKYIRLKYSVNRYVSCYTCGAVLHWTQATCGHGLLRGHFGTRFDERILRPQCTLCQSSEKKQAVFVAKLKQELGAEFDELQRLAHKEARYTQAWYRDRIAEYRKKVDELEAKL